MNLIYPPRDYWGCHAALQKLERKINNVQDLEQAIWSVEAAIEAASVEHEFEGGDNTIIKRFRMVLLSLNKTLAKVKEKPEHVARSIQHRRNDDRMMNEQKRLSEGQERLADGMNSILEYIQAVDRKVSRLAIADINQPSSSSDSLEKTTFILDEAHAAAARSRAKRDVSKRGPPRGFGNR